MINAKNSRAAVSCSISIELSPREANSQAAERLPAPLDAALLGPNSRAAERDSVPNGPPPREASTRTATTVASTMNAALSGLNSRVANPGSTSEDVAPREANPHVTGGSSLPMTDASRGYNSRTAEPAPVSDQPAPSGPNLRAAVSQPALVGVALRGPNSRTAEQSPLPKALAPSGPIPRAAEADSMPIRVALREHNSRPANEIAEPHPSPPIGTNFRPAIQGSAPIEVTPVGLNSRVAIGQSPPVDAAPREASTRTAEEESMPIEVSLSGLNVPGAGTTPTPSSGAPRGSDQPGPAADRHTSPSPDSLLDPALALAADFLDDVERVKIANENRLRAPTRAETDADGVDRYIGLDSSHPVVAQLAAMVESLSEVEHQAVLNLQRMLRKHPLHAWVKAQRGVGEKQAARLLAVIGDPYLRPEIVHEDGTVIPEGPRTVSALWAYCGLHVLPGGQGERDTRAFIAAGSQLPAAGRARDDAHEAVAGGGNSSTSSNPSRDWLDAQGHSAGVAARRRKGFQANWNTKAKTRAYLIAESCLKQLKAPCHAGDVEGRWVAVHDDACACSPYRVVYDRRKMHTSVSRPEWTDGHRHADALRISSKEILKHLWRAAREHHSPTKEKGTSP